MQSKAILAHVDEEWFTVEEIADRLKVSVFTVQRWLRERRLSGHRLGGKAGWRISGTDLKAFLARLREGADDAKDC